MWRFGRVTVRIGKPMDFTRFDGLAGNRFIERAVIDEVVYELMTLSGQEYVDIYAASLKEGNAGAAAAPASRRPVSRRQRRVDLGTVTGRQSGHDDHRRAPTTGRTAPANRHQAGLGLVVLAHQVDGHPHHQPGADQRHRRQRRITLAPVGDHRR